MINKNTVQTSESIVIGVLLAFCGGFLDVITYLTRGNVFTYAITGNLIFLGICLANREFSKLSTFIFPIIAFAIGIFITDNIKYNLKKNNYIRKFGFLNLHWRQYILIIELFFILMSANIPIGYYNFISNILLSLISGMQTEAFKKFHGNNFASTMCTGNLKSATYNLHEFFLTKNKAYLKNSMGYLSIIFSFFIGALLGGLLVPILSIHSFYFALIPIIITIILMFKENIY